jgi:hypothetical protein
MQITVTGFTFPGVGAVGVGVTGIVGVGVAEGEGSGGFVWLPGVSGGCVPGLGA